MSIFDIGPYMGFVWLGLFCVVLCLAGWLLEQWANRRRLRSVVYSNLNSAYESGHFEQDGYLHGLCALELAHDLTHYAEDCYDLQPRKLLPYVRAWLSEKGMS